MAMESFDNILEENVTVILLREKSADLFDWGPLAITLYYTYLLHKLFFGPCEFIFRPNLLKFHQEPSITYAVRGLSAGIEIRKKKI